jgi:hypothetical protein
VDDRGTVREHVSLADQLRAAHLGLARPEHVYQAGIRNYGKQVTSQGLFFGNVHEPGGSFIEHGDRPIEVDRDDPDDEGVENGLKQGNIAGKMFFRFHVIILETGALFF